MKRRLRVWIFFISWLCLAVAAAVLNGLNMEWGTFDPVTGAIVWLLISILQGSVLEIPVQVLLTVITGGHKRMPKIGNGKQFSVILNYNLLASDVNEIDDCIQNMYYGYMENLSHKVSAVLVSATKKTHLKRHEIQTRDKYRRIIFQELYREGLDYSRGRFERVNPIRLKTVWRRFKNINKDLFIKDFLSSLCQMFAKEFMVIHRISGVLRKCGQYQDLILLSAGHTTAFTYCDEKYYSKYARPEGQILFEWNNDVKNIIGRKFDYTLVLDGDTELPPKNVFRLLDVAAAYPNRGIIQPAVVIHCKSDDPLFMHLETARQKIYEPMTNAVNALLGQCSFYGKGLIKNVVYIDNIIGSKENLIERVPIDVLSHDTYEASILRPIFVSTISLKELPPYNYVSWNIRERRWNRGEVLNAMYFWKTIFGYPMRQLQKLFQREDFVKTKRRSCKKSDFVSSYVAHSPLRQMAMKPILLLYILVHVNINLYYMYTPLITIMFLIVVFPKIAVCNRRNYKLVLLETLASIIQFTPEAVVGFVRIVRAMQANIFSNIKWVPSRQVEEEFRQSNPFLKSFQHLWGYSVAAVIIGISVYFLRPDGVFAYFMLSTVFVIPLYSGITSCKASSFKCHCSRICKQRSPRVSRFGQSNRFQCSAQNVFTSQKSYTEFKNSSSSSKNQSSSLWTTSIPTMRSDSKGYHNSFFYR